MGGLGLRRRIRGEFEVFGGGGWESVKWKRLRGVFVGDKGTILRRRTLGAGRPERRPA